MKLGVEPPTYVFQSHMPMDSIHAQCDGKKIQFLLLVLHCANLIYPYLEHHEATKNHVHVEIPYVAIQILTKSL